MESSDLPAHLQLDWQILEDPDRTIETTWRSDSSLGIRREKVITQWQRVGESPLGEGGNGTVWLERSNEGQCRAVKEVRKNSNITSTRHAT